MDAQKAQIRTASVAIGIKPKSAQNGGSSRAPAFKPATRNVIAQTCEASVSPNRIACESGWPSVTWHSERPILVCPQVLGCRRSHHVRTGLGGELRRFARPGRRCYLRARSRCVSSLPHPGLARGKRGARPRAGARRPLAVWRLGRAPCGRGSEAARPEAAWMLWFSGTEPDVLLEAGQIEPGDASRNRKAAPRLPGQLVAAAGVRPRWARAASPAGAVSAPARMSVRARW